MDKGKEGHGIFHTDHDRGRFVAREAQDTTPMPRRAPLQCTHTRCGWGQPSSHISTLTVTTNQSHHM